MQPTTSMSNGAAEHWLKSWRLTWLSLSDKVTANCLMSFPASMGHLATDDVVSW